MTTFFIDANIPMYWAGTESDYREACGQVLTDLAAGRLDGVTDTEILQEILYRYTCIGQPEGARRVFDNFWGIVNAVLPVAEQDMLLARKLHERYNMRPRDLVHAAVMLNAGIIHICSADKDFDAIEGIQRIDPRDMR